jgi:hypothetical protein
MINIVQSLAVARLCPEHTAAAWAPVSAPGDDLAYLAPLETFLVIVRPAAFHSSILFTNILAYHVKMENASMLYCILYSDV